jgi:3-hydroxyisobutyrate dehydrogenase
MKTGVIGLGAMGGAMAVNLARAGLLAEVWNRSRDKAVAIAAQTGCAIAASPSDLAAACDVVITSVSADADLLSVIDALSPGVRPGSVIIDTSTVSADTARRVAAQLAAAQAAFLDAPVSGGPIGARDATLSIMVGGDAATLARVRPVFEAIGKTIVHIGDTGTGQAAKAVNQILVAGIMQGISEALAFGVAQGLPMTRVIEAVGSGAAQNRLLDRCGRGMLVGDYSEGFKLSLHHKDLTICKRMAAALGVQLPIVEMTLIHYRRLMEAGHGDEDISALHRAKQAMFETPHG